MTDLVFFYGTLMSGFKREGRTRVDLALEPVGHGYIQAVLFDMGIYPAAVPALDGRVHGEVHRMLAPETVLQALDEFEGYSQDKPDTSLYLRSETSVSLNGETQYARGCISITRRSAARRALSRATTSSISE